MRVEYRYLQRATVECTGTLEIPASVAKKGKAAVHEYIREHEVDATGVDNNIIDWHDEVEGTMEYEKCLR